MPSKSDSYSPRIDLELDAPAEYCIRIVGRNKCGWESSRWAKIEHLQKNGRVRIDTRRSICRCADFKTNRFAPRTSHMPKIDLESGRVFFSSSSRARSPRWGALGLFAQSENKRQKAHFPKRGTDPILLNEFRESITRRDVAEGITDVMSMHQTIDSRFRAVVFPR